MRTAIFSVIALLAASSAAQSAGISEPNTRTASLSEAPSFGLVRGDHAAESQPTDAPAPHYRVQPSGLDRIDPANMRVFGGEIGGNGVKGGAVVSLTWPTDR
ncbi:MAG TPA: hypothetical protein VLC74_06020 [Rhizomicrobium sp.]|nr:hypothetical protein [Rhizomicrobium sp.]